VSEDKVTLEIRHQPPNGNLLARFTRRNEVDQLPICVRLEGCECRHKIDRFQQAGLALGITAHQHDNPPGHVQVQAGKIAEIGQGEMFEIHPCSQQLYCWRRQLHCRHI